MGRCEPGLTSKLFSRWSCLLWLCLQLALLPSVYTDTLMDYLDPNNMPSWCVDCEKPGYLESLWFAIADNLYSASNWMMLGVWSLAAHEIDLAYFSMEIAQRLADLVGQSLNGSYDWAMLNMEGNYPETKRFEQTRAPYLWQQGSTMVLDALCELFLPLLVDKTGRLRLTRAQLSYFTEALAMTHSHIPSLPARVSEDMLQMPGLRRAAALEQCWATGFLEEPVEQIAARIDRDFAEVSLYNGVVYVFNPKVASSAFREFFTEDPGGMVPRKLGRSSWPRLTWFSFVRDPLKRVVAAFFEIHSRSHDHDLCEDGDYSGGKSFCRVGMSPLDANPNNKVHRAAVLERFIAMLRNLEDGLLVDEHTQLQIDRLILQPEKGGVVDFIGEHSTLESDWMDLNKIQKQLFNLSLGPLPRRSRVTKPGLYQVLNTSVLPAKVVHRVCNFYRRDYCCLQLPIPPKCRRRLTC